MLVEKTFTATVAGAEEVVTAARRSQVFAMEAMWTRFQPAIVAARELIADGAIGEVRQVQADLGVDRPYDPSDRLFDPAQGGGAMLDLGVYVVSLAQHFLGNPDRVTVSGSLAPTGVDAEAGLLFGYDDGRAASLLISLRNPTPGMARIHGTKGWIEVPPRFHHPKKIVLQRTGKERETIERPAQGAGYSHELVEVERKPAGRSNRERGDAAGRHPRRAAHPQRRLRAARRAPPRRRRGRGVSMTVEVPAPPRSLVLAGAAAGAAVELAVSVVYVAIRIGFHLARNHTVPAGGSTLPVPESADRIFGIYVIGGLLSLGPALLAGASFGALLGAVLKATWNHQGVVRAWLTGSLLAFVVVTVVNAMVIGRARVTPLTYAEWAPLLGYPSIIFVVVFGGIGVWLHQTERARGPRVNLMRPG